MSNNILRPKKKHTMYRFSLALLVFLFISSTHSAPADGKYPRVINMNRQQAHEHRINEFESYGKIIYPMETQRREMNRKLSIDPTRLIDKHELKTQNDQAELHRNNFNNLDKIAQTGGGLAILDKSKSGNRFTYTPVNKPKTA